MPTTSISTARPTPTSCARRTRMRASRTSMRARRSGSPASSRSSPSPMSTPTASTRSGRWSPSRTATAATWSSRTTPCWRAGASAMSATWWRWCWPSPRRRRGTRARRWRSTIDRCPPPSTPSRPCARTRRWCGRKRPATSASMPTRAIARPPTRGSRERRTPSPSSSSTTGWSPTRWKAGSRSPSTIPAATTTRSRSPPRGCTMSGRAWSRRSSTRPTGSRSAPTMSAAASAPRSSSIPNTPWSPGRRRRPAGPSNGPAIAATLSSPTSTARDNVTHAELALDAEGRMLALRATTYANLGAYLSNFASLIPAPNGMYTGVYAVPAAHISVKAVFTHTVPVDAYRGAGRPEASYVVERLADAAARRLGLTPAEFRRRNFIAPRRHALHQRARSRLRQRRVRPQHGPGRGPGRLGRFRGGGARRRSRVASCAASACPTISRSARSPAARPRAWM